MAPPSASAWVLGAQVCATILSLGNVVLRLKNCPYWPATERWSSLWPPCTEDKKMPPKCIAKRRSPPEDAIPKSKKVKVSHRSHHTEPGLVLTLGQGDMGQLWLGENVLEGKKRVSVPLLQDVVQAETGVVHTVCLSQSGQAYSFGCNDEGALGRNTGKQLENRVVLCPVGASTVLLVKDKTQT